MVMVSHRRDAPRRARNTAGAQARMRQAPLVWPLASLPATSPLAIPPVAPRAPTLTCRQGACPACTRNPGASARVGSLNLRANSGPRSGRAARSSRLCPAPLSRPIPGTDNRLAANEVQT
ncbi:hypothetical protein GCM10011341_35030 [Frigidibacter albus]|nr:hypothetical protein GCM10011341_35030 [Frigidibacter albus]